MDPNYFFILQKTLNAIGRFIWAWWWLPLPFFLFRYAKFLYLWYLNDEFWAKANWMVLEIKVPKETERPIKAMEQVITSFWTLYDPPDFKEQWFEGKYLLNFSLEIAGIDGKIRFFIYLPGNMRHIFESAIYSQYPEVEIEQVPDYTSFVPKDIPNKHWDLWACNFRLRKGNFYPIKTYQSFFEPSQEIKEERRVDPLSVLLEGMSRLQPGEQLWFQIILTPVTGKENPWLEEGKRELNRLLKRPEGPGPEKSIVGEAFRVLTSKDYVPFAKTEQKEELIPSEMKLSPGEREIVQAIENKLSKQGFQAYVRMVLLGKKEAFFKPHLRLVLNFSTSVSTQHLNQLTPFMTTKIVAPSPFREARLFIKKRMIFKRYIKRWGYYFPKSGGALVFNPEEIATLWHFPSRMAMPSEGIEAIEAKKASPPPNLPIG